jgi:hypothetical protein
LIAFFQINNEQGRDYTRRNITPGSDQPSILGPQATPNAGAVIPPPHSSVPSAATNAVAAPGVPIRTVPAEPLVAQPSHVPVSRDYKPLPFRQMDPHSTLARQCYKVLLVWFLHSS